MHTPRRRNTATSGSGTPPTYHAGSLAGRQAAFSDRRSVSEGQGVLVGARSPRDAAGGGGGGGGGTVFLASPSAAATARRAREREEVGDQRHH